MRCSSEVDLARSGGSVSASPRLAAVTGLGFGFGVVSAFLSRSPSRSPLHFGNVYFDLDLLMLLVLVAATG
jgi:hypothetical protein